MNSNNSLLGAWSYLTLVIAYTFFLIKTINYDLNKSPKLFEKNVVIIFTVLTLFWGFFSFLNYFAQIEFSGDIGEVLDFLRYGFWCYIFIGVAGFENKKNKNIYTFILVAIFLYFLMPMIYLLRNTGELNESKFLSDINYYSRFGRLGFSIFSLVLIEHLFFLIKNEDRWKIKHLSIGLTSIFIFDLYFFSEGIIFGHVDSDASAIRGLVHSLIVPLIFLSMTRRSRNYLKLKFTKNSAFNSFSLVLSGSYLILISSVGYYVKYFGGEWGRALQVAAVYISLFIFSVIVFSDNFRSRLKVYIGKNFFHYKYDYREEWLNFTNMLVDNNSNIEMGLKIVKGFSNILQSPSGCLWVRKSTNGAFHQVAQFNQLHTQYAEDAKSSFCQFMARTGWVINIEQYQFSPEIYGGMVLPLWIHEFPDIWLIVPLLVGEEMIGFCTLDKARHPVDVNWEVNDLLKTAGRQAAAFIAQMQATEALLESRKFAAFNRMSAFVVHDLKNIVTQLSLMMKNSQRLLSNPEFQKDMLLTVDNSLVRMRQLMLQLRESTQTSSPSSGVNLEVVLERLEDSVSRSGRKIELNLTNTLIAQGQEDRVERILGHLVQNALDATDTGGRVQLFLNKVSNQAEIVLCDSGQGMSPEFVSQNLFKPFQSTKQNGMGIGAYESFLYIQELCGSINVESKQGIGTTITILLPLFDAIAPEVNHVPELT